MTARQLDEYAHQFYRSRGVRAEYEAANKARKAKDPKEAANWRRIRELVRQLRAYNLA